MEEARAVQDLLGAPADDIEGADGGCRGARSSCLAALRSGFGWVLARLAGLGDMLRLGSVHEHFVDIQDRPWTS